MRRPILINSREYRSNRISRAVESFAQMRATSPSSVGREETVKSVMGTHGTRSPSQSEGAARSRS
jgi:hypothetical protein